MIPRELEKSPRRWILFKKKEFDSSFLFESIKKKKKLAGQNRNEANSCTCISSMTIFSGSSRNWHNIPSVDNWFECDRSEQNICTRMYENFGQWMELFHSIYTSMAPFHRLFCPIIARARGCFENVRAWELFNENLPQSLYYNSILYFRHDWKSTRNTSGRKRKILSKQKWEK